MLDTHSHYTPLCTHIQLLDRERGMRERDERVVLRAYMVSCALVLLVCVGCGCWSVAVCIEGCSADID